MERDFFSADKLSSFGNFLNKPGFTLEGYLLHGEKTAERVLACQRVDEWLTQHAEELEGIADKVTEKLLGLYSKSQMTVTKHLNQGHPDDRQPHSDCMTCVSLSLIRDSIGLQLRNVLPIPDTEGNQST